jgi:hypothetical protein
VIDPETKGEIVLETRWEESTCTITRTLRLPPDVAEEVITQIVGAAGLTPYLPERVSEMGSP